MLRAILGIPVSGSTRERSIKKQAVMKMINLISIVTVMPKHMKKEQLIIIWVIPLGWRKPLETRQFNTNTGGYGLYKLEVGLMAGGAFVGVGNPPLAGSPIDGFRGWANDGLLSTLLP